MILDEANQNANNQELLDKGKFLEFAIEVNFQFKVCDKKKNVPGITQSIKKNKWLILNTFILITKVVFLIKFKNDF